MSQDELYVGREQTLVKHVILESYLERFAHIIGTNFDAITYVDCFSGPWNTQSNDLKDSSFSIALNQLQKAKATHAEKGRELHLRCFFLEKNRTAYAQLKQFAANAVGATIETRNAAFEDSIDEILAFARQGGSKSFLFLFIDPTGWTGFAMEKIAPLLRVTSSEVLINFMTSHIHRFIDSPDDATHGTFDDLFGKGVPRQKFEGLTGIELDDALAATYGESVSRAGKFDYVRTAMVIHPEINKIHFHLIYATRNAKGVEVFKAAEEKAMSVMESMRADAHQRKRLQKSSQQELFPSDALYDPSHFEFLRQRYLGRSQRRVLHLLNAKQRVSYDDFWDEGLREPLVWERDLKVWIAQWVKDGHLQIEGLKPREKTPKRKHGHYLVWKSETSLQ